MLGNDKNMALIAAVLTKSVMLRMRLGRCGSCVHCVMSHLFLLFIGEDRTKVVVFLGPQVQN